MLPIGTQTIHLYAVGNGTTMLVNDLTDKTILGVAMQQENTASLTTLRCGSDHVVTNYATNLSYIPMDYNCDESINVQKTGNDTASIIVNWLPFITDDYATSTYNPPTEISTSSDVIIYGSMSAGEVLISFFLFIIIMVLATKTIAQGLSKVKTGKTFLQYNGGDVEMRNDL